MLNLDWCHVPAGKFLMGSEETSDNSSRMEYTEAFLIGKYPVTNRQFAEFIAANPEWRKGAPPDELADGDYLKDWDGDQFPQHQPDHPVAWIPWHSAAAFCEWASQEFKTRIFLPSEKMWEKAGRGPGGRVYPWGNEIDGTRANYSSRTIPVGRLVDGRVAVGNYTPRGDSPYGCADMAGNVWEWCADWLDEYEEEKALRGGGWNFTPDFLKCYFRFGCEPRAAYNYIGFRCAAIAPKS